MFLTTELGGSVSITNTLRADTVNWVDPTIQPTIIHSKQATGLGKSDQNHFPIRSLNSGIHVPRSGRYIDNCTGMNPQGPIVSTIPESNRTNNFEIFVLVRKTVLPYMSSVWHVTIKIESENLVENLRGKKSKNAERKNNFEVEKLGAKIM